jgi:hypothetical protein
MATLLLPLATRGAQFKPHSFQRRVPAFPSPFFSPAILICPTLFLNIVMQATIYFLSIERTHQSITSKFFSTPR